MGSSTSEVVGVVERTTLPTAMTIGAFTGIAWYNVFMLNLMIWISFRRHAGLYFWSLLLSSWGILFHSLAWIMMFFEVWTNVFLSLTIITIGWYCMVTGQSLVLWSRLHLVVPDAKKIRWVLYMIITDAILFHIPTTALTFGADSSSVRTWKSAYNIYEKIQLTAFCIQEFIISGLYIYYTRKMLHDGSTYRRDHVKKIMRHLIYINAVIIVMDLSLLATEYANLYEIQITYKSALYSIKLQLEFNILNQLVAISRGALPSSENHSWGQRFAPWNFGADYNDIRSDKPLVAVYEEETHRKFDVTKPRSMSMPGVTLSKEIAMATIPRPISSSRFRAHIEERPLMRVSSSSPQPGFPSLPRQTSRNRSLELIPIETVHESRIEGDNSPTSIGHAI